MEKDDLTRSSSVLSEQGEEIMPAETTEEREHREHREDQVRRAEEAVILGPVDPAVEERLHDHTDMMGTTTTTTIIYTHAPELESDGTVERGLDVQDETTARRESLVPGRTESFVTAMTNLRTDEEEEDSAGRIGAGSRQESVVEASGLDKKETEDAAGQNKPTIARPAVVHDFPLSDETVPTTTTATTTTVPSNPAVPVSTGPSLQFAKMPTPSTSRQQQQAKEKEKTTMSLKTWWKGFSSGGSSSNNNNNNNSATPTSNPNSTSGLTAGSTATGVGLGGLQSDSSKRMRKGSVGEGYGSETVPEGDVFAQPLLKSLEYASVQISTAKVDGGLYIWGYVPVVVAKCGLYLKDTATEVPGTFRVSGSAKRMKELQAVFDNPPKYGKNLDWKKTTYTTHDVATILRRYLTQMPEPIIPHELYHEFRNNLLNCREHTPTAENSLDVTIKTYQNLIAKMPKPNQYLLLYVLDLLSVFARKSEVNLMTAPNLAVIFQPGIISHTEHEMRPAEHALSQAVLEFLIEHQDHFLLGMQLEPIASRSSDAAASGSDVFHPAASIVTSQSTRDETEAAAPVAPPTVNPDVTSPSSDPATSETPATDTLVTTTSKTESAAIERRTSREPTTLAAKPAPPGPPPPPAPVRADSDLMIPSDSDDEAPVGGYYVKTEDPTRLQASIGPGGVIRSRTVMDRKSPRAIPIVQEYHSDAIEEERKTGSPAKASGSPRTGGLRAALSVRRTSRTSRVVSNDKPPAVREAPPGVIIVDNPPLGGVLEAAPSTSRLFRRRTAPTRRHRNKDEEDAIRKQAEEAVKKLGTGSKKQGSAEV